MTRNLSAIKRARVGAMMAMASGVALYAAFPDTHDPKPPGWTGPVFKLSQAYPATLPAPEPTSQRAWTQFDFKKPAEAPQYLQAVLNYCLEGNAANNFADVRKHRSEVVSCAVAA